MRYDIEWHVFIIEQFVTCKRTRNIENEVPRLSLYFPWARQDHAEALETHSPHARIKWGYIELAQTPWSGFQGRV